MADSGRSLAARDTSGGTGNLTIVGNGAKALGIFADESGSLVRGTDLERQYISMATSLSSLNFGRGTGNGTFTITDSTGSSGIIDIDPTELAATAPVNPEAVRYLNRLSDLLFVAARYLNDKGAGDILWRPGANR